MKAPRYCPACQTESAEFGHGPNGRPNALCPVCGSLERHRVLVALLERLDPVIKTANGVLDIAPHKAIRRYCGGIEVQYVGLDLERGLAIDVQADLTHLPFNDGGFDVVICYQVLEHIPDDRLAMRELARVLAPGGLGILQVPRRPARATIEDPAADAATRIELFGQADHVRFYGYDFEDRAEQEGLRLRSFQTSELLDPNDVIRFAVDPKEEIWLARSLHETSGRASSLDQHLLAGRWRQRALAAERDAGNWRAAYDRVAGQPIVRVLLAMRRWLLRLRR